MKENNKILFLLHIPPPVHGSSVVGLSIKNSKILNSAFDCDYINLLASQDIAESGTVNSKKLLGFAVTWGKLLVTLRKFRPDICYLALTTTGTAFFRDVLLIALLKIFRINRIYHLHNKGVSLQQHKTIYRLCYNFVFKNSEVIILSLKLYSDIQSFVPKSKIHICPNGIPDEASNFLSTQQLGKLTDSLKFEKIQSIQSTNISSYKIKDSRKVIKILFLSNLIESKGVFVLLDACNILKKKKISFECIFAGVEGDISTAKFNEHVNNLELGNLISYQGKKLGTEKIKTFNEADIFVFPTHEDCFPLVLLEAMSYSFPIVSTYEGGIQNIVEDGETGILVPQKNVEALADKLELLIQNPELRLQMGVAGRKKYEQEFTLDRFENRLKEILQQIIENK